jgi:predicted DNA-binding transcriptional regulator AlpA
MSNNFVRQGLKDTDAAKILGLHPQTLRNKRSRGEGPPYVKLGRAVRYFEDDLIAYLDKRKIEPEERQL